MPKRSSKSKTPDLNEIAHRVVAEATGESEKPKPAKKKNAAAVVLGRMGGRVGGKARAESLTPERRKEIARQAAMKRWSK